MLSKILYKIYQIFPTKESVITSIKENLKTLETDIIPTEENIKTFLRTNSLFPSQLASLMYSENISYKDLFNIEEEIETVLNNIPLYKKDYEELLEKCYKKNKLELTGMADLSKEISKKFLPKETTNTFILSLPFSNKVVAKIINNSYQNIFLNKLYQKWMILRANELLEDKVDIHKLHQCMTDSF